MKLIPRQVTYEAPAIELGFSDSGKKTPRPLGKLFDNLDQEQASLLESPNGMQTRSQTPAKTSPQRQEEQQEGQATPF